MTIGLGPSNGLEVERCSETETGTKITLVSFGTQTLSHELAHVVLLEQLYRALSVLEQAAPTISA